MRVFGDENAMPTVGTQKTIHQRNKSSPALSTMANAGGVKAAAKRTAFGDVSNTANALRPSKDDLILGKKGHHEGIEKLAPLQEEKKSTALLRPAQRPLSVSGLKGLLNNVTHSTAQAPPAKQSLVEVQQSAPPVHQTANTRKVLTKRNTAVFKDQSTALDKQIHAIPEKDPLPAIIQTSIYHDPLSSPAHLQSQRQQVQTGEPTPKLRKTKSKPTVVCEASNDSVDPSELVQYSSEEPILRSDGVYIDTNGQLQIYQFDDEVELSSISQQPTDDGLSVPAGAQIKSTSSENQRPAKDGSVHVELAQQQKRDIASAVEAEEYWDDEDEEYNYDEEGYVTARSYRSRSDNTTSGATTILFPKMNLKAKKELAAAKAIMEAAKEANEIDDETWDTTMVAEYGDEIFQYMRELEIKMLPNAHYMDNQAEIQWSMRSVLMDWLVQVHQRFGLLPETLFLCCNYIDRFLSCKIVSLGKLQLVGATAIFVAAKYEEINCPSVQEIVYMVDNGYTVDEILKAERFMLSMLQFELGWPGPMSFLRRISKADDYDLETRTLAKYFLELTIMDERFVGSPPSFIAAGAHCLARMMLKKGHWVSADQP